MLRGGMGAKDSAPARARGPQEEVALRNASGPSLGVRAEGAGECRSEGWGAVGRESKPGRWWGRAPECGPEAPGICWHRRGRVPADLWRGEPRAASESSAAGPRGPRRARVVRDRPAWLVIGPRGPRHVCPAPSSCGVSRLLSAVPLTHSPFWLRAVSNFDVFIS